MRGPKPQTSDIALPKTPIYAFRYFKGLQQYPGELPKYGSVKND